MELWDAYLADGAPAGGVLVRGEPIPKGLYHLVAEVLVRHTDGSYLLMRRDAAKPNYGGWYEATAGGSALRGEDSLACARRELREETGIVRGELTPLGQCAAGSTIYHQFLCVTGQDKTSITLQAGETTDYCWLSEEAFAAFIASDEMIPSQRERYRRFFVQMGYLR